MKSSHSKRGFCDIETKLIESLFEPNVNLRLWVKKAEAFISQNGGRTCHGTTASSLTDSDCGDLNGDGGTNVTHPIQFNENISNTNCQGFNLGTAAKGKTSYEAAIQLLKIKMNMILIY